MDKLAVVILNYNGKNFLEKFLPSVMKYSSGYTVVVADNASTDDSVQFVKTHYPEIKIIINNENGGFAKGYNDALKHVSAEYYVLLNSDIEVTPNWIEPCLSLLETEKEISAVQPKIIAWHDQTKFEHAGAAGGFLDKNFYPFCQGRIFEITETDEGQYNRTREIFWATGACMFIRSKDYHEAGGLDADFFAHMEEIDLCWRLKLKGKRIFYCAQSKIYHVGGGTLNYMNPKKTYLNFRNSLYMMSKNYQGFLPVKIFMRLCLDGVAGLVFILKGQFKHCFAVIKAHFSFYGHLGTLLKQRRAIRKTVSNPNFSGQYKRNIVVRKFVGGLKFFTQLKEQDFFTR
ncbi:MAG: glycosyltransferase family 2 protein [Crocinitomicaceae bacterium]|nr:glycosyltransferase family 2 protein [Crocinitomicaceae bacterium]MBK8925365.1 glycosyltransferase family 2 protein [Crocinitomicaceae bacterium]